MNATPSAEPGYRDGNALLGMFAEIMGIDLSLSLLTCASCGARSRFAESHVYDHAPGAVIRCPRCTDILARVVRTPRDLWLDLRGSVSWQVPLDPA